MKRVRLCALVLFCLATNFVRNGICQSTSLKGIETGDLDRKADPCNDFYEYSNGTWRAQNPIPNSMDRWSRRWKAGETNKDQLKIIPRRSLEPPCSEGYARTAYRRFLCSVHQSKGHRCSRSQAAGADTETDRSDQDSS